MKGRPVTALTNAALAVILIVLSVVCFFPAAGPASGVEARVFRSGSSQNGVSLMVNVYEGTEEVYEMLDCFGRYGARVTFFLGGCWADDNVECVRAIAAAGHEIGSHGYFHLDHASLGYEDNVREIATSVEFLSLVLGSPVTLFAPPSGAYSDETVLAAERMGLKTILWSKDTIDWRDADSALVLRRAQEAEGGDFVLMHPKKHTVAALPRILEGYRARGLSVIPVGENLQASENP